MRSMKHLTGAGFAVAAALGGFASLAHAQTMPGDGSGAAAPASAQPPAPLPPPFFGSLAMAQGKGKLIKLPRPVANLFVADDSIASVRPASPGVMFVFGKQPGTTDIVATDQDGNRIAQYAVTISPSDYQSSMVQSQSASVAPGSGVTAQSVPGGMVVRGTVETPEEADNLINRAKAVSGGNVINELNVNEPIQVELKVRIASMSRNVTRELGIDWGAVGSSGIKIGKFVLTGQTGSAAASLASQTQGQLGVTFPGGTFEGVVDALATDNLAHVLAEPTLTTLSGTQANFQVGGQFPIPAASGTNGTVSVTYKDYGVLLSFIPTVLSDGRIALQVAPQFSTLNTANSSVVSTGTSNQAFAVPSLNVTAASTTVILGSGQGMAIAGLLEDTTNQVDNGVPGLSEIPLLGALFRGDAFQRQQQELVITVTPYLVNPVNNPGVLASPDDGWTPANDLQRILELRDNGTDTASTQIPGDAGFMVQ